MKFITSMVMVVASSIMVQSKSLETFISNGSNTTATVEYYAYLEIFRQDDFGGPTMYFGGGTLISTSFVLTVAQNVAGFKSWRIGLGANRISNMQWFYSTTAFIHHGYNNETLVDNVALLRLNQLTSSGTGIKPIYLPYVNSITPLTLNAVNAYGFGFGTANHQPDVLQKIDFSTISQEECGAKYPHLDQVNHTAYHFCAARRGLAGNFCAGDQGGPVTCGTTVLEFLGIQSFYRYENCSSPEAQPAAFIRIAKYVNWINNVTKTQPLL